MSARGVGIGVGAAGKAERGDAAGDDGESVAECRLSGNPEFLSAAFAAYCRGLSLENVAGLLRPEYPGANERTMRRICAANGWEKSRATYLKMHAEVALASEGMLPEVIMQLQRLRTAYEGRIGKLRFMEVAQYRGLCDDLLWLTGRHPKAKSEAALAVSGVRETAALIEALQGDEVVGPAWRRRKTQVEKAYREKLNAKAPGRKGAKKDGGAK